MVEVKGSQRPIQQRESSIPKPRKDDVRYDDVRKGLRRQERSQNRNNEIKSRILIIFLFASEFMLTLRPSNKGGSQAMFCGWRR
jgi:hypothetical protein